MGVTNNGYGISFWSDEPILELGSDDDQTIVFSECAKTHWIVHLEWGHLVIINQMKWLYKKNIASKLG